jgi:hypothetical protein
MCRFCIIAGTAAFVMKAAIALGGFMLIESARRSAIAADERTVRAEASIWDLRSEIDALKSASAIERWASVNGFVPSYKVVSEEPQK